MGVMPLVGMGLGAVGSIVGGINERRQRKLLEKQSRAGVEWAERDTTQAGRNLGESAEYQAVQNLYRDVMGMGPLKEGDTYFVGKEKFAYDSKTLLPASKLGTVGSATLEANLKKAFEQAQVSRGIYDSQIAASAEASGIAAWRTEKALEIAPALLALAERPTEMKNKTWAQSLQKNMISATGGKLGMDGPGTPMGSTAGDFGGVFSGLLGGLMQGASLGMDMKSFALSQKTQQLRGRRDATALGLSEQEQREMGLYGDEGGGGGMFGLGFLGL